MQVSMRTSSRVAEHKKRDSRLVREAVARAKAGDAEGLHFLYLRFAPDVLRYVTSFIRDHHEAEDITQNVFAKLMTAIKKYEQREVPFAAWILRVGSQRRPRPPARQTGDPDRGGQARRQRRRAQTGIDRGRDLRQALEELPEDQREVLVLRHIVGLSPVEIAGTLDKTESSVHGLHHRGRKALQASLVSLGAEPMVAHPAA